MDNEPESLFSSHKRKRAFQKCALAYDIMKDALAKCARLEVTVQARPSKHGNQGAISVNENTIFFYHPDK